MTEDWEWIVWGCAHFCVSSLGVACAPGGAQSVRVHKLYVIPSVNSAIGNPKIPGNPLSGFPGNPIDLKGNPRKPIVFGCISWKPAEWNFYTIEIAGR